MTVRSGIAAFSIGTSSASGPREMTNPPGCCERWRGKPRRSCAYRALRAITDHHGGERGAAAPVFPVDVLNHLLAPLVLEVDVDVRRLVALARDETLEEQAHARRVDFRDAERIAHHGVR